MNPPAKQDISLRLRYQVGPRTVAGVPLEDLRRIHWVMASSIRSDIQTVWEEITRLGVHAVVGRMTEEECFRLTEQYGAHNYHPLPVAVASGDGPWITDVNGKKFIDCVGSYSALAQGHLSEFIVATAQEQLKSLTLTSRAVYTRE